MRATILLALTGLLKVTLSQSSVASSEVSSDASSAASSSSQPSSGTASPVSSATGSKASSATALVQSDLQQYIDADPPAAQDSFFTTVGSSTSYIGPSSDLTTETVTTVTETQTTDTVQSRPVITYIKTLDVSVATITAADAGEAVGDLSIVISPALKAKWGTALDSVCGAAGKNRHVRRQRACTLSQNDIQKFVEALQQGESSASGAAAGEVPAELSELMVTTPEVAGAVEAVVAAGAITTAEVGWYTLAALFAYTAIGSASYEIAQALKIPKDKITTLTATPTVAPSQSGSGSVTGSDGSATGSASSSESVGSCTASVTKSDEGPFCLDQINCKGGSDKICSTGEHQGCGCQDGQTLAMDLVYAADIDAMYTYWSSFGSLVSAGITSIDGMTTLTDDASATGTDASATASGSTDTASTASSTTSSAPSNTPTCTSSDRTMLIADMYNVAENYCKNIDLTKGGSGWFNETNVEHVDFGGSTILFEHIQVDLKTGTVCTPEQCWQTIESAIAKCGNSDKQHVTGHGELKADTCLSKFTYTIAVPYPKNNPLLCSGPTDQGNQDCGINAPCSGSSARCQLPDDSHPYPYCQC